MNHSCNVTCQGLSCPCHSLDINDPLRCEKGNMKATDCPGGEIVKDVCGCCDVCPQDEGEKCGGPWRAAGTCYSNLRCVDPGSGLFVAFNPRDPVNARIGVCMDPGMLV
ncbi:venom protein 302-like [Diadema setosum]|uniref:venom protein 302-like n=1 Tax=Diadema setosum TaxID=31175 RepID=UPI003B3B9002